ncbi:hypothetical protein Pcinc_042410 [Petrolisthes cinctipes]|uniref:Uncharacterized protein n=1 Tax=Petrolisthes cinctipes TaxID=88211 RepID=A0AAE1BI21_PETCI|nr:hypothetical protein Pcinc_042410 [Petrolisthes cinctipes]
MPHSITSFYGRNTPRRTVIPGPVTTDSDDGKSDDEGEPTILEVDNDSDEDYVLPKNAVIEDDVRVMTVTTMYKTKLSGQLLLEADQKEEGVLLSTVELHTVGEKKN